MLESGDGRATTAPRGRRPIVRPGLVSVTFRSLAPREIVRLSVACGLEGIEWGGDVHAPDAAAAREVRRIAEDAGLATAAYGSYWRAGETGPWNQDDLGDAIAAAVALGAPTVRVWAGAEGSEAADASRRARIAAALREACGRAGEAGMTLSLEYHGGTLTDTLDSTLRLVGEVDHPALRLLWQPVPERPPAERLAELRAVRPWLSNLHVFQWTREGGDTRRHPLVEGESEWIEVLRASNKTLDPLSPPGERGQGVRGPGTWARQARRRAMPAEESPDVVLLDALSPAKRRWSDPGPRTAGRGGEGASAAEMDGDRFALLEFVPGDDPAALPGEAATLRRWLSSLP